MSETNHQNGLPWCAVCIFYIATADENEKCPNCGGELEPRGEIPKFMVSSIV